MGIARAPRRIWLSLAVVLAVLPLLGATSPTVAPRPEDPRLTNYAYEEMKRGDYRSAIEHLRARIKANKRDANAVFLLGVAHARVGEAAAAAHDLQIYRRHGGTNPELPYELGLALLWSRGDRAEAVFMLETYRKVHPESAKASLALGEAYIAVQRYDDANALFQTVRSAPAQHDDVLFWLATLEKLRGNDAAARAYLDELMTTSPQSPRLLGLDRLTAGKSQP